MRLSVIGTGDAAGVPVYGCECGVCRGARVDDTFRRRSCCALIEAGDERILVDAGITDFAERFPPGSLSRILLTHYHMDHIQGLFPIRWGCGAPVRVHGPDDPAGNADLLKHPGILDFSDTLEGFLPRKFGRLEVTPLPLRHSKPTLGYALGDHNRRIAWLTDTSGLPERTEDWISAWRPDVMVIDCTHAPQEIPPRNHNDLNTALRLYQHIRPGMMLLTHISHTLDQWLAEHPGVLPPGVRIATDGLVIEERMN